MSVLAALLGRSLALVRLDAATYASPSSPNPEWGRVRFAVDGRVLVKQTFDFAYNWKLRGSASDYEILCAPVSGSGFLDEGVLNTWLVFNGSPEWRCDPNGAFTGDFSIRLAATSEVLVGPVRITIEGGD